MSLVRAERSTKNPEGEYGSGRGVKYIKYLGTRVRLFYYVLFIFNYFTFNSFVLLIFLQSRVTIALKRVQWIFINLPPYYLHVMKLAIQLPTFRILRNYSSQYLQVKGPVTANSEMKNSLNLWKRKKFTGTNSRRILRQTASLRKN